MVTLKELVMPMVVMVVLVVVMMERPIPGRSSHVPRGIHELAVEPPAEPALIRFGHGRKGRKLASHRVVPEGPLDDLCRMVRPRVPPILPFQQLNLLVQEVLGQFVPM